MKINYVVNPIVGGWSPWDMRVGGSEECVIETARRLHERGHEVTVFHNGKHGRKDGVLYADRGQYLQAAGDGVTVNLNYSDLPPQEPTVYWTSLYPESRRDLSEFKEVLALSQWQIDHSGIRHNRISIVPPGYDAEAIKPGEKIPKTVLYASSPDRGLDNLARVWPDVAATHPDAQLLVTYGGELDLPNCICLGEVSAQEMNELYATSDIWCHPCSGGELYCMTGIKAQVALCVPVYYPHMALSETVRSGWQAQDLPTLTAALKLALAEDNAPIREALATHDYPDWTYTTDKLENVLLNYS